MTRRLRLIGPLPARARARLTADEIAGLERLEKLLPSEEVMRELLSIAMSASKEQLAAAAVVQALILHDGDVAATRERLCREANLAQLVREGIS